MTDWDGVLDAIEEHQRRVELVLRGELEELAPLDLPSGQVPPELAPRLAVLSERGRQLQAMAQRRRAELDRAMAYAK